MSSINQTVLATFTAVALGIGTAAQAATPLTGEITFDPDGAGGANSGSLIAAFDWSVSSFLGKNAVDVTEGDSFQIYEQAFWAAMSDKTGGALPQPTGLFTDFEITLVTGVKVEVDEVIDLGTSKNIKTIEDGTGTGENFFVMYYDDSPDSDPLTGDGYGDGIPILEGVIIGETSNNDFDLETISDLDEFVINNWPGISTIQADGAQEIVVLVTFRDTDFFPDLPVSSYIPYTTEKVLSFQQQNPAQNLTDSAGAAVPSVVSNTNGIDGPDLLEQIDPNNAFAPVETPDSCRVTGGGNDTSGIPLDGTSGHDGTEAEGETFVVKRNGRIVVDNRYTFGGQAGANTALQPQPKGELSHTNHSGSAGQWTFHAGTASAPPGTEVDEIICSDEGWCRQARPAPTKQIDFTGIGSFRSIKKIGNLAALDCPSDPSDGSAPGRSAAPPKTYHWFEVHIEDLGEPGREGQHTEAPSDACPAAGSGNDAFDNFFGPQDLSNLANCDCPDFYRLRVYCGVVPDDVDGNGKADLDSDGNVTNFAEIQAEKYNQPIYEVFGYINGGNWQIHPLTGFDLKGGQ